MATATVNGVRLHYGVTGSGTPLLLIHGSWGSHGTGRRGPTLALRHEVIACDRPGHSAGERPNGQGPQSDRRQKRRRSDRPVDLLRNAA